MVSAPRLMQAFDAMETVERDRIEGAVVECGVWAGGSIGLMAAASKRQGNTTRMFHLFDSFEGLPQPSEHDVDVLAAFQAEYPGLVPDNGDDPGSLVAIGACEAPLEDVHHLFFNVLKIDAGQVAIHKGWFQDTLPIAKPTIGPIAILRVDGDWYESTKVCLEELYENVVLGGYVIVDDYGTFSGCAQAVDEFIEQRAPDVKLIDIDGEGVYFRKPL
jgi:O-methyltransferase